MDLRREDGGFRPPDDTDRSQGKDKAGCRITQPTQACGWNIASSGVWVTLPV